MTVAVVGALESCREPPDWPEPVCASPELSLPRRRFIRGYAQRCGTGGSQPDIRTQ